MGHLISSGIPAGQVSTYGGVAHALHSSARAVGGALRVRTMQLFAVYPVICYLVCRIATAAVDSRQDRTLQQPIAL